MPAHPSEWRKQGNHLLRDGEPHHIEDLLVVMSSAVPPGRAVRARRAAVTRMAQQPFKREVSTSEEVRVGQRAIALGCIHDAVRQGTWIREGDTIRLAE